MIRLPQRLAVLSPGMKSLGGERDWLARFIQPSQLTSPPEADALLAWGRKASAARTASFSRRLGKPMILCEDAFLRSIHPGPKEKTYGLVFDDLGIYYDCRSPSRLEELAKAPLNQSQQRRARTIQESWCQLELSKYNHARAMRPLSHERFILVVDQTRGDLSISAGDAEAGTFARMLDAALSENPSETVVVKLHPEVVSGAKKGHFWADKLPRSPRLLFVSQEVHPCELLEKALCVYTVTSQLGFEALLWQKRVRTFGMPFYAGWGLTQDELPAPQRRGAIPLDQLVYAALIGYAQYVHPLTRQPCEVEELMTHLGRQRRRLEDLPALLYATGFSRWKRPHLQRFFPTSELKYIRSPRSMPEGSTLLSWGSKGPSPESKNKLKVIRIEDGFLRSVGLGAALTPPVSWVSDTRGIYYDPNRPSELEYTLCRHECTPAECERAAQLRKRIAEARLTKYNVGKSSWQRPRDAKRVLLVTGQVESDASIVHGATNIRTNLSLLQSVRQSHPDAHIVYKPHPDVVAGLRSKGRGDRQILDWCDTLVTDVSIDALLEEVDEVHTITSLAGFEALLRGTTVLTYGRPFYAGWGLTVDKGMTPETALRRSRRLSLDELVFGALIRYPTYVSINSGHFIEPEQAIDEIQEWMRHGSTNNSFTLPVLQLLKW